MSIRDYYKSECKTKIFIEIKSHSLENAIENLLEVQKWCNKITNTYTEILIKINE